MHRIAYCLSVISFLDDLKSKSSTNRDARIQYAQMARYIQRLCEFGTRLGYPFTKHLEDGIWELRPGCNRVLFFFYLDNTFVLLQCFSETW